MTQFQEGVDFLPYQFLEGTHNGVHGSHNDNYELIFWLCITDCTWNTLWALSQYKDSPGMRIPMLKIRQSQNHLIFNTGIPMLVRRHLYIGTAHWWRHRNIPTLKSQYDGCWFCGFSHSHMISNHCTTYNAGWNGSCLPQKRNFFM